LSAVGCWLALAGAARADLPVPRLDRIAPMGAGAGESVDVEVAAADDLGAELLLFDHPGITATFTAEHKFKVSVAADVPQGTYDVRLVGRFGASSPRLFQVTRKLTELAEKEPNNTAEQAQEIPLGCVVNGTSDNNEADIFRIAAKAGQRITLDCVAGRLDSQIDAVMTLATAQGQLLATSSDYFGRDPMIDFQCPADGEYLLSVNDLSYRGGFLYRLVVSDKPQIENVEPRALTAGKPTDVTVYGRNLGPAAQKSPWIVGDLPLDQFRYNVQAPADLLALGEFRFAEHPVDFSVLPSAATCTLVGYQILPPLGDVVQRATTMLVTPDPVLSETEPNDQPEAAQLLTVPVAVSGRFDRPRDLDIYAFDSGEGGSFACEVFCERIAGRADAFLTVQDEQGNTVVEGDDFGHRMNAFDGHLRDPVTTVDLKPHQKYRALVGDRYGRGSARLQYVLTIHPARPDFFIAAIHRQNPGPAGVNIWRGGTEWMDIVIHRTEGNRGPITLTAENLPAGVHAVPTTIQDGSRGTFVLWSDPDAPIAVQPIALVARAKRGEEVLTRAVRPYSRVWQQANVGTSRPTRQMLIATCETAPLRVTLEPAQISVEPGKPAALKAVAKRYWPDAANEVRLAPLGFQGNFQLAETVLPAGAGEVALTINVQANTPPGDYTMAVQCQSQVPYAADPKATSKPNNLVTFASLPVTITVLPPPEKK
jgi:hypothetical protein